MSLILGFPMLKVLLVGSVAVAILPFAILAFSSHLGLRASSHRTESTRGPKLHTRQFPCRRRFLL